MKANIEQAVANATDEQKAKYGLNPEFLDLNVVERKTGIQVNINDMKGKGITDEDKSRFLLTVLDICKDAGIELSVSHGSRREMIDPRTNIKQPVFVTWPSLWYNAENATAQAAKQEATELRNELAQVRNEMKAQATATTNMFSELKALMMQKAQEPANTGTSLPG